MAAPEEVVKFTLLIQQATNAMLVRGAEAGAEEVPRGTASASQAHIDEGAVESTTLLDTSNNVGEA